VTRQAHKEKDIDHAVAVNLGSCPLTTYEISDCALIHQLETMNTSLRTAKQQLRRVSLGVQSRRCLASSAYTDASRSGERAVSSTPEDMTPEQRRVLEGALRVDQAGEIAANWIYRGQYAVLGHDRKTGPLIQVSFAASNVSSKVTEDVGNVGARTQAYRGYGQASTPA
jgi:Ubiquinone biosynthesis protein COQ7